MEGERFRLIKEIFNAALEHEPERRDEYLAAACAGDDGLRREVDALLAQSFRADNFLETPAIQKHAEVIVSEGHAKTVEEGPRLKAGELIGDYQIVSLLGRGGMGEVYLARDTRIGRKAAIKVLLNEFFDDEERVRRFEQEARTVSNLNHPNIVTVYEVEIKNSPHFIATEFVEGQTLRQKLEDGLLDLREVMDIGQQVAAALSAAHAAGVAHRDIKPENVMLRKDGYVKVLDFGIAKRAPADGAVDDQSEQDRITATGAVLGTAGYMSPEQARGVGVDTRSDIFSLGVLIYEMIVGRRPFIGKTVADVIAAILTTEPPPLREFAPQSPAKLERIVTRALRKEPESRYQSIDEMLAELKSLKESSIGATDPEITRATDPEGTGPGVKVEEEYEEFNPLLSELDFSPRLRNWVKRNPLGGVLALLTSLSALVAILLGRYVGAAGIRVTFKSTCGVEVPDLYFGYLIELNAGLLYLIGAPLIVATGFHLLNFAHVALRRLTSGHRLVVNQRDAEEGDDRPLAIIARHNRKLCGIAIPIIVIFAITLVAIPEYRSE